MSAIEASSVRVATMADGTLRLTLDIEPAQAQDAFALFGKPGQPVALAAIKTAAQQQATERPKGGSASKWLGIRCGDPEFQEWIERTFPDCVPVTRGQHGAQDLAAITARLVCNVTSRAEIDNNPKAFAAFDRLIRQPWIKYQESK